MHAILDLLPELLSLAFYAVGTVGLSALGVYLEEFALETAAAGQPKLGLWIAFMGCMAFYFGPFLMGYHEALPRFRALREA